MTPPLLFISGEYPPDVGGVGDYTERLRGALASTGWQSGVLSRRQVRRWDARSLVRLARTAPRTGIVHIQFQAGAFDLLGDVCLMPTLLRRLRPRTRVVTTFHDARPPFLFPKAGRWREQAVRLLAQTSHAVVAADARDLATLGGPSPRHHHVPIGSNVQCAPPVGYDRGAFRTALGFAPETLVLVYFGLRNASKGLEALLDTFQLIAAQRPGTRLMLLGGELGASDPTDRATALALRQRLDPTDHGTAVALRQGLDPSDRAAAIELGQGLDPTDRAAAIELGQGLDPSDRAAAIELRQGLDPSDRAAAIELRQGLDLGPLQGGGAGQLVLQTGWLAPGLLSAYLLAADIALLPYADGASPRRGSLLACAEHGLPIVTTKPAAPEVADAVHAVDPDPRQLAEAVLHLARTPQDADRLRAGASALAERTAWPRIAQAHIEIYEQLMARPS